MAWLAKTWTGLPVEKSVRMTEDRDNWRKYVLGVANPRIEDGLRTEQFGSMKAHFSALEFYFRSTVGDKVAQSGCGKCGLDQYISLLFFYFSPCVSGIILRECAASEFPRASFDRKV